MASPSSTGSQMMVRSCFQGPRATSLSSVRYAAFLLPFASVTMCRWGEERVERLLSTHSTFRLRVQRPRWRCRTGVASRQPSRLLRSNRMKLHLPSSLHTMASSYNMKFPSSPSSRPSFSLRYHAILWSPLL